MMSCILRPTASPATSTSCVRSKTNSSRSSYFRIRKWNQTLINNEPRIRKCYQRKRNSWEEISKTRYFNSDIKSCPRRAFSRACPTLWKSALTRMTFRLRLSQKILTRRRRGKMSCVRSKTNSSEFWKPGTLNCKIRRRLRGGPPSPPRMSYRCYCRWAWPHWQVEAEAWRRLLITSHRHKWVAQRDESGRKYNRWTRERRLTPQSRLAYDRLCWLRFSVL